MIRWISIGLMSLACVPAWTAERTNAPGIGDVATLHARVITPASDLLFQAESTPPSTAQDWEKIRASALELEQAATQLGSKVLAKDRSPWIEFAGALQRQAQRAAVAAENKDQDALVAANGDVISVCEDCHAKYRDAGRSMKE